MKIHYIVLNILFTYTITAYAMENEHESSIRAVLNQNDYGVALRNYLNDPSFQEDSIAEKIIKIRSLKFYSDPHKVNQYYFYSSSDDNDTDDDEYSSIENYEPLEEFSVGSPNIPDQPTRQAALSNSTPIISPAKQQTTPWSSITIGAGVVVAVAGAYGFYTWWHQNEPTEDTEDQPEAA